MSARVSSLWNASVSCVRLTSGGRDVDVDADLWNPAAPERRHAGVSAEVGELEVDDVQVGGSRGDVGVGLGDDHAFWTSKGTAVLQPAEHELLGGRGFHLAGDLHLAANLDVVVVVVRVWSDPETALLQRWNNKRWFLINWFEKLRSVHMVEIQPNQTYQQTLWNFRKESQNTSKCHALLTGSDEWIVIQHGVRNDIYGLVSCLISSPFILHANCFCISDAVDEFYLRQCLFIFLCHIMRRMMGENNQLKRLSDSNTGARRRHAHGIGFMRSWHQDQCIITRDACFHQVMCPAVIYCTTS